MFNLDLTNVYIRNSIPNQKYITEMTEHFIWTVSDLEGKQETMRTIFKAILKETNDPETMRIYLW